MSKAHVSEKKPPTSGKKAVQFDTWQEVAAYMVSHGIKPVKFTPRGKPVYSYKDMQQLNLQFTKQSEERI